MEDHAALLRRAAAKARETAEAYEPTPFELADRLDELGLNPRLPANHAIATRLLQRERAPHQRNNEVALAVAEWLEQHEEEHSTYDCQWEESACAALKTARALLNHPEETP